MTAFTARALDFFLDHGVVAERLMADNAFAYIHNRSLRDLFYRRAIRHIRTRPYTPRTNVKVERYQQTLQREWAYALEYASSNATRAGSHCHTGCHYNERRTHSALGNRPPLQRVREVHRAQQLALRARRRTCTRRAVGRNGEGAFAGPTLLTAGMRTARRGDRHGGPLRTAPAR